MWYSRPPQQVVEEVNHAVAEELDSQAEGLRIDVGDRRFAVSVLPVREHARQELENSERVYHLSPKMRRNRPVAPMLFP